MKTTLKARLIVLEIEGDALPVLQTVGAFVERIIAQSGDAPAPAPKPKRIRKPKPPKS